MALSFTYTSLRNAIIAWTENSGTDFTDQLDTIIGLAELRLMRDANLLAFRKTSQTTLVAGDPFVAKPTDFVTPRFFFIYGSDGNRVPLLLKDVSFVTEYWSDRSNDTGQPKYYANWDDDTFIVAPTPDLNYTAELGYNIRLDSLSSSNSNTWLSTKAGDALFYCCLLEAVKFMKEDKPAPTSISMWQESYAAALDRLIREEHFEVNTDDLRQTALRRQENMVPADK